MSERDAILLVVFAVLLVRCELSSVREAAWRTARAAESCKVVR